MLKITLGGLVGITLLGSLATTAGAQETRILVDSIHAHNALTTQPDDDNYRYHTVYGYRRAFDYLRSRGVKIDEANGGVLEAGTLQKYQLLFLNLVSADLPPFRVGEIAAIKTFVENGGALFVITDHSNCYYHGYKLMPLFEELGLEVKLETACDRPPALLGQGNGWLAVTRFSPHPVTAGLETVGIQTGGPVDDKAAIATISPQGWGDSWDNSQYGEHTSPGLYGNWKQDVGERSGTLGVIAAKTLGKGRILVVGDQNVFGDPFLNYADNAQLWLNGIAWTSGASNLTNREEYYNWRPKRVLAYEQYDRAAWGDNGATGYYSLFAALGRKQWLFASSNLSQKAELIVFAHDGYQLNEASLNGLVKHLQEGRNAVVLGRLGKGDTDGPLMAQLRARLGPPAVQKNGNAQAWQWDKSGQVLLLADNRIFRNSLVAPPEQEPSTVQTEALNALSELLDGAMGG